MIFQLGTGESTQGRSRVDATSPPGNRRSIPDADSDPRSAAHLMERRVSCPVCAEVIGVYEPVLVPEHGEWRATSLAREPDLRHVEPALVHVACAPRRTS